jgi:Ca2+/Na+ antiporter
MRKRRLSPCAPHFLGAIVALGLTWNLGCCLYSALSHKPLLFYLRNGAPHYFYVAPPWLDGRSSGVVASPDNWGAVFGANLALLLVLLGAAAVSGITTPRGSERNSIDVSDDGGKIEWAPEVVRRLNDTTEIFIVSRRAVRNAAGKAGRAAVSLLLVVLLSMSLVSSNVPVYLMVFGLGTAGALIVWWYLIRAGGVSLVFSERELRHQRKGRLVWTTPWEDIDGWYLERQSAGSAVRRVVVRCKTHGRRCVDVHSLGLPDTYYADITAELQARTGMNDESPQLNIAQKLEIRAFVMILLGLIVGFIVVVLFADALLK